MCWRRRSNCGGERHRNNPCRQPHRPVARLISSRVHLEPAASLGCAAKRRRTDLHQRALSPEAPLGSSLNPGWMRRKRPQRYAADASWEQRDQAKVWHSRDDIGHGVRTKSRLRTRQPALHGFTVRAASMRSPTACVAAVQSRPCSGAA
jgi:hypothetical protein